MDNAAARPFDVSQESADDEQVLAQAAQRDPAVFGDVYKRFHARIYSYLRTRTRTDEDAVDLTAQVFLQAFKALPRYQDRGMPFVAWLFRIARNAAVDAHRKGRSTVPLDMVPESQHPLNDEGPETGMLRHEEDATVRALLAELPADKRELVLLRFAAGLTLREIAAIVGKSESTVHHHLRRALETLKERHHEE